MKFKPNQPIDPRSFKIYYGWILVPLAVIGVLMSLPGQTAGFSAFTEPILLLTGFTRTRLSLLYFIGTVSSGFLIPVMGSVLDSWGSRKMMVFASIAFGITLFWLSFLDRIVGVFPSIPSTIAYSLLMVFGIFSLRFFGQGLLPITSNTMVGKWFDKKRGRAIAVIGTINTVAFSAAPVFMADLVFRLSWNGAWRSLAVIVGIGMSLIAWIFYRDTPESCGLSVDGDGSDCSNIKSSVSNGVTGVTRRIALRSRSFWAIALVTSSSALVLTGFTFHIQVIGMQAGMTVSRAVSLFIPSSFIAVPISFIFAILSEKIHARILVTSMAVSQLTAYLSIYKLDTSIGYLLTIVAIGCASGLLGPIIAAVIPKIFGRRHLGSINGVVSAVMIISIALGPVLLSAINDITGSFQLGIALMSIQPLITFFVAIGMSEECS